MGQVSGRTRPSGAFLRVLKGDMPRGEAAAQHYLMSVAGVLALPVYDLGESWYTMPVATPLASFPEAKRLTERYRELWQMPAQRSCDRITYHQYVMGRPEPEPAETFIQHLKQRIDKFFDDVIRDMPITDASFVHGDATFSNAVLYDGDVRMIDFSPRQSPPEREVDAAKLLFSAAGFDTIGAVSIALKTHTDELIGDLALNVQRVRYYFLSHLIRVASREPERAELLEGIYDVS